MSQVSVESEVSRTKRPCMQCFTMLLLLFSTLNTFFKALCSVSNPHDSNLACSSDRGSKPLWYPRVYFKKTCSFPFFLQNPIRRLSHPSQTKTTNYKYMCRFIREAQNKATLQQILGCSCTKSSSGTSFSPTVFHRQQRNRFQLTR